MKLKKKISLIDQHDKNGFWGGQEAPDGNPLITSVDDIPQDQGGFVGVLFDKSMWDNYQFVNKITEYSI